jgi:hypothetical protein
MAIGQATFGDIGGGISDLFAAQGDRAKAAGDIFEAQNYDLAAKYADQEAFFTKESTAIQSMQSERQTYQSMSQTRADIAGGGLCGIRLRPRHPCAVRFAGRVAEGRHRAAGPHHRAGI